VRHKYSKEILYHFNCGKCNKWWSIADYHLFSNDILKNKITCPSCGHKEEVKEVKNEKE
jgi:DNA-directed RNA polymerase subunit RPC12/RpoP|tara:strand:+ start:578 stop:754 length:177 start_codon:yes stop_codon:yes gene_type:complete